MEVWQIEKETQKGELERESSAKEMSLVCEEFIESKIL